MRINSSVPPRPLHVQDLPESEEINVEEEHIHDHSSEENNISLDILSLVDDNALEESKHELLGSGSEEYDDESNEKNKLSGPNSAEIRHDVFDIMFPINYTQQNFNDKNKEENEKKRISPSRLLSLKSLIHI